MASVRFGVLGCSTHYLKRIALPVQSSLIVEPWAIASRSGEKAAQVAADWGFEKSYGSYEELLADKDVDFVYNPLPNHMHLEWIKKAADAGKHTLCEKPLCLNAAQAREAADYCRKKGVLLMEAFMYRFHPQWIRARELAQCFELGNIHAIHGWFTYNNKDPRNIRNIAEYGGGALMDIGCYAVSSARFLFNAEPERVVGLFQTDPDFGTDKLTSGILDFGKGRRATFTVGTQSFPYQRVEALGDGGSLSVEVPFNMYGDCPGRIHVATGVGQRTVETEIVDQYMLEFDAFATAIAENRDVPTPIDDALANMAVIDALVASAKQGGWVDVKRA